MPRTIMIATRNPAKIRHFTAVFATLNYQCESFDTVLVLGKPPEPGQTAEENSLIKATYYAAASGMIAFSEDEALYVDFLPPDQQPGPYVRRVNHKDEANDDKLFTHWDRLIRKAPQNLRTGHWRIAYTLATPDGMYVTRSLIEPVVFFSPPSEVRIQGWPMSSLHGPAKFGRPHSELTEEERITLDRRDEEQVMSLVAQFELQVTEVL